MTRFGRWCRCGHREISHGPERPPFAYCTGYQRRGDPFAGRVYVGHEIDPQTNGRHELVDCTCEGFRRRRSAALVGTLVSRIAPGR
ncbi:MAG TPA: hypothetical protein VGQ89_15695 [Candidatus Limnocylindrales bacterium]|jgi:hypothetical protein|nr:hypothetical protein [Candidatus Limnocylindrales bacterium]